MSEFAIIDDCEIEAQWSSVFYSWMTLNRFKKVCKYWQIMNSVENKITNCSYARQQMGHNYYEEDEDYNITRMERRITKLKEKLGYHWQEYEAYVAKLGYELGNAEYHEALYALLNDGNIITNVVHYDEVILK